MAVYSTELKLISNEGRVTYLEITEQIREYVRESKISEGICSIISPHTTCSVIFAEHSYDTDYFGYDFLQLDLNELLEKLIPDNKTKDQYHHPGSNHIKVGLEDFKGEISPEAYTMLNTDAHLKSTLIGTSETFAINEGEIQLGKVGYIYFIDWDRLRSRERKCYLKVIGE